MEGRPMGSRARRAKKDAGDSGVFAALMEKATPQLAAASVASPAAFQPLMPAERCFTLV